MNFHICSTEVSVGFPFAAAVTLMLMLDRSNTALAALLCCILHETGHLVCMAAFHAAPERVTLGVFGMRIDKKQNSLSYLQEAAVALAGPAVNILLFTVLYALYKLKFPELLRPAALNLCTGLFNLIPVEPLDGSRALSSVLLTRYDSERTEKLMNIFTAVTLLPLTACGIAVLKRSGYNFTLLIVCVYIAIYLVVKSQKQK